MLLAPSLSAALRCSALYLCALTRLFHGQDKSDVPLGRTLVSWLASTEAYYTSDFYQLLCVPGVAMLCCCPG